MVLSGMSAMSHVVENVASAERSGPGTLAAAELALFDQVRDAYRALSPIPCTDCKYCMPCPNGVDIPRIFAIYNDLMMYGAEQSARASYNQFLSETKRANHCVECGECEEACPQGIAIIDWLKKAHATLVWSRE